MEKEYISTVFTKEELEKTIGRKVYTDHVNLQPLSAVLNIIKENQNGYNMPTVNFDQAYSSMHEAISQLESFSFKHANMVEAEVLKDELLSKLKTSASYIGMAKHSLVKNRDHFQFVSSALQPEVFLENKVEHGFHKAYLIAIMKAALSVIRILRDDPVTDEVLAMVIAKAIFYELDEIIYNDRIPRALNLEVDRDFQFNNENASEE